MYNPHYNLLKITTHTIISRFKLFLTLKLKKKRLKYYKFFLIAQFITWNNLQTHFGQIILPNFILYVLDIVIPQNESLVWVTLVNSRLDKQLHICKRVDIFDRHKASVIPCGIAKWEEKGKRERDFDKKITRPF